MNDKNHYKAIIIGAGQGGKPLAVDLASAGWKTALIEDKYLGGTCVNVGCSPTKTMVASARVAHLVSRSADYGINRGELSVNLKKIRERKQKIVDSFRSGSENHVRNTENLDLFMGEASFLNSKTISLKLRSGGTTELTAEYFFINTGGRPAIPAIEGLDKINYLDSTSIMELSEVPRHLVVLGGGYIGLEFGQMFFRFGARVTIIDRGQRVLGREDADVSEEVARILKEEGLEIFNSSLVTSLSMNDNNMIDVHFKKDGSSQKVSASHLLVAVGRVPNTERLNLIEAGVETDQRGFIKVDEKLNTSAENIFALGDVKGGAAFTHIAYDDYRILKENILNNKNKVTTDRLIPYVVFIDPQLARVGLSENEAKEQNINYKTAVLPMTHVARALETDETKGFMKVLVDPDTDLILGAVILGVEGGEILTAIQMAMIGNLKYQQIRDTAIAHPTFAESLNNLFMRIK